MIMQKIVPWIFMVCVLNGYHIEAGFRQDSTFFRLTPGLQTQSVIKLVFNSLGVTDFHEL